MLKPQDRRREPECVHSPVVRSQTDSRRCLRQILDLRGCRWERTRPCRASHFSPASTVQWRVCRFHTFSLDESHSGLNNSSFGQVMGTHVPRDVQLGGKITFWLENGLRCDIKHGGISSKPFKGEPRRGWTMRRMANPRKGKE